MFPQVSFRVSKVLLFSWSGIWIPRNPIVLHNEEGGFPRRFIYESDTQNFPAATFDRVGGLYPIWRFDSRVGQSDR